MLGTQAAIGLDTHAPLPALGFQQVGCLMQSRYGAGHSPLVR